MAQSVFAWLTCREYGSKLAINRGSHGQREGGKNSSLKLEQYLWKRLYGGMPFQNIYKISSSDGVFGLKYSPNGKVLVAACENHSLLLLDPVTEKIIKHKENAHRDCCNNVSFIDERLFASCSDDKNISIWDLRNLKKEVFCLEGHNMWVKNVDLHRSTGQLVSSGFDDSVRLWDLNSVQEDNKVTSKILLEVHDLLRMRISADGDSMYLTSSGFSDVIGIHNLDLATLNDDVEFILCMDEYQTLKTKKSEILHISHGIQTSLMNSRNRIDRYRGSAGTIAQWFGDSVVCHSIDVHPRNCALLLLYIGSNEKTTSICNTRRYYGYCSSSDEKSRYSADSDYFPVVPGLNTNMLQYERDGSGNYIQEVCFSSCGRLIASPFGYGVTIATFDEEFNDYETHIVQKLNSMSEKISKNSSTNANEHNKNFRIDSSELCGYQTTPCNFSTVKSCFGHQSAVLSTCFSPTHIQLATGSEKGLILFHNPVL